MASRLNGLWRHPDFVRLWTGQTISVFGSLTTRIALPFTAVIYLDARPFQVALVTTSDVLAGICFALFAGVWVDRLRKRPIMISADIGRAAIIASIPIAAAFGLLRVEQLYAVAFLAGILTTFFDVAYQTYLPTLVDAGELVEGNSKLTASASVAEFGAFSFAGWLVQLITAPGAMAVDAVSFLFSAGSLKSITKEEPAPGPAHERQSVRVEIIEGLRAVAHDPILRALALSWVAYSAASGVFGSVFVLYVTRDLGLSPAVQGVIYGVGGITSFFGALVADWCRRRLGAGGAMILGMAMGGAGVMLIFGASAVAFGFVIAILVAQQIISDPGWTVYEINAVSLRQATAPEKVLGRVNAATRFCGLLAMLVFSVIAGAIAGLTSPGVALVVGASTAMSGALVLFISPVRSVRGPAVEVKPVEATIV